MRRQLRYNPRSISTAIISSMSRPTVIMIGFLTLLMCMSGCAEDSPSTQTQPAKSAPSHWRNVNGSTVVGVDVEADASIAAAIDQARSSAETARAKWTASSATQREQWAIKWGARTADQRIEHVWVHPLNWSPFRVEGMLISQPVAELECGKGTGDLVSFPIEELSDWIHYLEAPDEITSGEFEGGFTVKALEARFGKTTSTE